MSDYANPNPLFQPAMRIISSITTGVITLVQTTFAHQYNTGLIVRIIIPDNWGMQQMNGKYGAIIVTGPDTFTMNIDSSDFDQLLPPSSPVAQNATPQVVPIGEANAQLTQATRNILG